MRILIVSATAREIKPLMANCQPQIMGKNTFLYSHEDFEWHFLITGVGMPSTIFSLSKYLFNNKIDGVVNAGICGAYGDNLHIGEVIRVGDERFADLGMDNNGTFVDLFDMGFSKPDDSPFVGNRLFAPQLPDWAKCAASLPLQSGLTLNTATGSTSKAAYLASLCPQGVETMESAAFFYTCIKCNLPFVALRAVSNKVELRNTAKWNIPLAIDNLNLKLMEMISSNI
jgi:futalosine hydrolase